MSPAGNDALPASPFWQYEQTLLESTVISENRRCSSCGKGGRQYQCRRKEIADREGGDFV
jgi:hypothetical protein